MSEVEEKPRRQWVLPVAGLVIAIGLIAALVWGYRTTASCGPFYYRLRYTTSSTNPPLTYGDFWSRIRPGTSTVRDLQDIVGLPTHVYTEGHIVIESYFATTSSRATYWYFGLIKDWTKTSYGGQAFFIQFCFLDGRLAHINPFLRDPSSNSLRVTQQALLHRDAAFLEMWDGPGKGKALSEALSALSRETSPENALVALGPPTEIHSRENLEAWVYSNSALRWKLDSDPAHPPSVFLSQGFCLYFVSGKLAQAPMGPLSQDEVSTKFDDWVGWPQAKPGK